MCNVDSLFVLSGAFVCVCVWVCLCVCVRVCVCVFVCVFMTIILFFNALILCIVYVQGVWHFSLCDIRRKDFMES